MTYNPDEARDEKGEWAAAQAQADKVAGGHKPLEGLPQKPINLGGKWYVPGPIGRLKDAAASYMKSAGLPYDPPKKYVPVDVDRSKRIADAFDEMKHTPTEPATKASYDAMIKETQAQWEAIKATGLKVDWIKPGQKDPYAASPRLGAQDVSENNHWWGFPTDQGFGTGPEARAYEKDSPVLKKTGEVIGGRKVVANDVFRIVHDMNGHMKEGNGFRAGGEENAWRSHAAMYSDLARPAMTAGTRGQNSWVNYGPHGVSNRTADSEHTVYAPQKMGLLPKWVEDEGRKDD